MMLECGQHSPAQVRLESTFGPDGPRVELVCTPGDGAPPHRLSWKESGGACHPGVTVASERAPVIADELSPAECQVLLDAANGLTGVESARQRGKSSETVKTQRSQIVLKLGARNLTNAVCIAVTTRIITPN